MDIEDEEELDGFFARFWPHGKEDEAVKDIRFETAEVRAWWIETRCNGGWLENATAEPIEIKDVQRWDYHEEIENSYPEWFEY